MVIKGRSCNHVKKLAQHLMRADQNERVEILELDPSLPSTSIEDAFEEFQMLADHLSNAKYGLYETSLSPKENETLTRDQWEQAVDMLADQLGLSGQPRVVVLHQKKGREHVHAVFQRTDTENMKVISDSHTYPKHEIAAREIEKKFELEQTVGVFTREKDEPRPVAQLTVAEHQQQERTGIDKLALKKEIKELFKEAETSRDLMLSLEEKGYYLARGDDSNIFMIVDQQQGLHRLSSMVKVKEVKAKLHPLKLEHLKTANETIEIINQQVHVKDKPEELKAEQVKELETLTEKHKLALGRMEAKHRIENEAEKHKIREAEKEKNIFKRILRSFGDLWYSIDVGIRKHRDKVTLQLQEYNDLKRLQLNEKTDLIRIQKEAWHKFDQEHKPDLGNRARTEVGRHHVNINILEQKYLELKKFHGERDRWKEINYLLEHYKNQKDKIDFLQGYLDAHREALKDEFREIFKSSDEAQKLFEKILNKTNDRVALYQLRDKPEQFGELNLLIRTDIRKQVELAAFEVKKIEKYKEKIKEINGLDDVQKTINRLELEKLEYFKKPSNTRLALLRDIQMAYNDLPIEERDTISDDLKIHITQANLLMKNRETRERAEKELETIRQHKERRRKHDLERNRELDPYDPRR